MFFVFNGEKIKSYLVSLGTVAILLVVSVSLQNNAENKVIETSVEQVKPNRDIVQNDIISNNIENIIDIIE